MTSLPWTEKYRPADLSNVIQKDSIMDFFNNITNSKEKEMPHLILHGSPGVGKTSTILAFGKEIFREHYRSRVIEFNASDDRGINAVRDKITNAAREYVSTIECDDGWKIPAYKIIVLDEADSMTDEAQDALRVVIEKYSTVTRFCFICNYLNKIRDAIQSRCLVLYFKKIEGDKLKNKLKYISEVENMKLNDNIYDTIIDVSDGDLRKAIIVLQSIKYKYDFGKFGEKSINDMNPDEIKLLNKLILDKCNFEITPEYIYNKAGIIHINDAVRIFNDVMQAKNIKEINTITNDIISTGFNVDGIMAKLNDAVLQCNEMSETVKAEILLKSSKSIYCVKDKGSQYIQLLSFLIFIYMRTKKN